MNSYRPAPIARGLSIVEMLVGIAVGLFVLAGAAMVATGQITDNRRLLLETQIHQDLRTAMDVIVRDVRRSGYSFHANKLPAIGAPPSVNGYSPAGSLDAGNALLYTYSAVATEGDNRTADPTLAADAPDFKGFMWDGDVIKVQLGRNNWQPLTDGEVVQITEFTANEVPITTLLPTATCGTPPCGSATGCGNARVVTRIIQLKIVGRARHDNRVERQLESAVRVRNDEVCL
jgi:prepilin peptidase dependent protein B